MKRTFVTGAGGFVGANLARRLLRDGNEVHVLLREPNAWRLEEVAKDLHIHLGDLRNAEQLTRTIEAVRPEWIFHLAAYGAYSWQTELSTMIETNITGTMNLLNACLTIGFAAFVNAGSSSEYGLKDHAPLETEFLEPNSNYAVTKASATLFCRSVAKPRHASVRTLRLYSGFGPYEEPRRLIPSLIVHGLKGELPKLASPDVARDYVYIDDVVEAFVQRRRSECRNSGVYNLGTAKQTSLREVVDVARQIMKIAANPVWSSMPNRQWDTDRWVAENTKIQRELQWRPRISFEEGLRKTIDWFREHPKLLKFYEQQLA